MQPVQARNEDEAAAVAAAEKCLDDFTARFKREPVLVSADKVHFVVKHNRRSADGQALSRHENVWIVARLEGRWGISVRSY